MFGDVPMEIELQLVGRGLAEFCWRRHRRDSCCKLALERGIGGALHSPSAYFAKRPPVQMTDDEAHRCVERFWNSGLLRMVSGRQARLTFVEANTRKAALRFRGS